MPKINVDSRTPAITQRLLSFAQEIEELDHVCQHNPEIPTRDVIVSMIHDAVVRLTEGIEKVMEGE